jgi:hypothetical protein
MKKLVDVQVICNEYIFSCINKVYNEKFRKYLYY